MKRGWQILGYYTSDSNFAILMVSEVFGTLKLFSVLKLGLSFVIIMPYSMMYCCVYIIHEYMINLFCRIWSSKSKVWMILMSVFSKWSLTNSWTRWKITCSISCDAKFKLFCFCWKENLQTKLQLQGTMYWFLIFYTEILLLLRSL